ncbi:MAG: hypothetical protein IJ533_02745 [Prevotella sp.]|nr:hypothetical protein [Prevotella sp.]
MLTPPLPLPYKGGDWLPPDGSAAARWKMLTPPLPLPYMGGDWLPPDGSVVRPMESMPRWYA